MNVPGEDPGIDHPRYRQSGNAASSEPIKMFCADCGKPWDMRPITTTWSRSYTCPCGGTKAVGSVTLGAWPDGGAAVLDGVERDYGGLLDDA